MVLVAKDNKHAYHKQPSWCVGACTRSIPGCLLGSNHMLLLVCRYSPQLYGSRTRAETSCLGCALALLCARMQIGCTHKSILSIVSVHAKKLQRVHHNQYHEKLWQKYQ